MKCKSTTQADNTNFEMRLVGEGWKERWPILISNILLICLRVDPEKAGMPPNRRVTTIVKGKNIGGCCSNSAWRNYVMRFCQSDLYRIWSHMWVHGSIGHCHPARDGKVKLSYIWSHRQTNTVLSDCQVLEGCTARVTPLRIQPLSPGYKFISNYRWFNIAVSQCWEPLHQKRT